MKWLVKIFVASNISVKIIMLRYTFQNDISSLYYPFIVLSNERKSEFVFIVNNNDCCTLISDAMI